MILILLGWFNDIITHITNLKEISLNDKCMYIYNTFPIKSSLQS